MTPYLVLIFNLIVSYLQLSNTMRLAQSGLLAVFKPKGITSAGVVNKIKYTLAHGLRRETSSEIRTKRIKVGHGGTLDPLAEGVLVIGIGQGTKLLGQYLSGNKGYQALGLLGSETDTYDSTGTITATKEYSHVTNNLLEQTLNQFIGNISQIPPMYSALKVNGTKLYDLARSGIEIEREARNVTLYNAKLMNNYNNSQVELPYFAMDIECSGGFYVRSLIRDLGQECHSLAHMTELLRTKQGFFQLQHCITLNECTYENICDHVLKCNELVGIPPNIYQPVYSPEQQ